MKTLIFLIIFLGTMVACSSNTPIEKTQQKESKMESIADKNKQATQAFFKALENENAEHVAVLFAENGVHINPYSSGIFPQGAKGREAIKNYWAPVFPNFDGMKFPIEQLYAMEDPNRVFVKFKGQIQLKNNAGTYENDYYATFLFNDSGLITEYVEIFNPIVAAKGFGLIDKIK